MTTFNNSKEHIVKDNLENIKKWLSEGNSIQSIAKALKISKTTLYKYLDGTDVIKNSREICVENLENAMFESACGYTTKVKKYEKVKRIEYIDGKKSLEYEELVEYEEEIYHKRDTTAGIFLLKNWGNYMNEPRAMEFRKKELELKEKQVDATVW